MAPQGVRLELCVEDLHDLSRQVVRSEHAAVIVKEVELEMPPKRERGELNTVEVERNLSFFVALRLIGLCKGATKPTTVYPNTHEKLRDVPQD